MPKPKFTPEQEKEVAAAARSLSTVIAHLGFYTDDGHRIEVDFPMPLPVARHWAERGVRYHPELAVIRPAKNDKGEDVWVPRTADDPDLATDWSEVDPEQIQVLTGLVETLQGHLKAATAAHGRGTDPQA